MDNPLAQERLLKLNKIRELGINPYPERFERTHYSSDALELAEKGVRDVDQVAEDNKKNVTLCGRMMSFRSFGKLTFAHLLDDKGKIQICFMKGALDDMGEKLLSLLDIGDFIGVSGELFKTKHDEITLLVAELTFLGKAILPLPEKWHGIQDQEAKYRQRYLDLVMSRETRERFELRSLIIRKLREFYWSKGFIELDTPILENISSGAVSKPFLTHHNALDIDVFLRIAGGELWHKMAIIGGFEKVFEVARVFRNEGMDPSHLQEFTMIEHYTAYWNFEDNMKFTEEMFEYVLKEVMGSTKLTVKDREGKPVEVDFKTPWPRENYRDLILRDSDIDIFEYDNTKDLLKVIEGKKIVIEDAEKMGYGNLVDHLYKKVTRPKLVQPTFVIKHPADTKPLARRNDEDTRLCDTFQLLVNGWEVVNAYSELVDPVDQRQRFEEQALAKAKGDEEAMSMNEEYLEAMQHGMPPISGWGLGLDRLVTLITQQDNLKDVVMFPLLRPKSHGEPPLRSSSSLRCSSGRQAGGQANGEPGREPANEDFEIGISYDEAKKLMLEHISDKAIRNHSLEAEAVMRGLAKHFGEDEEKWGILGLLHDIDWDKTKGDMKSHGVLCKDILKDAGLTQKTIDLIVTHVYGAPGGAYEDEKRSGRLQHLLAAGETVTGLIHAATLVRPDKKLATVEVKSIKKKFKDKAFAAGVDREVIRECEKASLELTDFLQIALDSMKKVASDVGL